MKKKVKGPSLLKRIMIRIVAYGMSAVLITSGVSAAAYRHSDQYLYDRIVQIEGALGGSCSGEQVKAPSGKSYILTAGHCRSLVEDGQGRIVSEDGSEHPAVLVAEDPASDLLLLQGIKEMGSLDIAKSAAERQEIRTFTHGAGLKSYKTSGVLIESHLVQILLGIMWTRADQEACIAKPKQKLVGVWGLPACIMSVEEMASTAFTAPGSSGGAVVDAKGRLVGVVSAGGGGYSFFVRLSDIQAFLADK